MSLWLRFCWHRMLDSGVEALDLVFQHRLYLPFLRPSEPIQMFLDGCPHCEIGE